jgi:DNA-binding NarL/FixJ family response regulator
VSADIQIRVVVIDDHPLFREGVASLIGRVEDVQIVGEASSAEEGIVLVHELLPDVVLMDLHMPGMGGIEAIRTLTRRRPDVG